MGSERFLEVLRHYLFFVVCSVLFRNVLMGSE